MRILYISMIAVGLVTAACSNTQPPTAAPTPAPLPSPSAAPDPTPDPSIPPAGSGCGQPYPPPISVLKVKIHIHTPQYWIIDSTPIVGPNLVYCREIGYSDGRSYCPVRPDVSNERVACEAWAVGKAEDTGKPGPTWVLNGKTWCTGKESGCEHSENPFQVHAFSGGLYQACVSNGVCASVQVDR